MQSSIVSIPLTDSWDKFLSDREILPSIVGPIPPITSYYSPPPRKFSQLPEFTYDFTLDPPIRQAMGRRLKNDY